MLPPAKPPLAAVLKLLVAVIPGRKIPHPSPRAESTKVLPGIQQFLRHDRTTPGLHRTNVRHTRYGMSRDGTPSRGGGTSYLVAPPGVNSGRRRRRTAPRKAWNRPKGGKPPLGGGRGGIPLFLPHPLRGRGPGGWGGVAFAQRMHGYAPQARPVSRGAAPDGSPLTCTQVTGLPFGAEGGRPP